MDYAHVDYAMDAGVAEITLNDPATLNAFSSDMALELLDALRRAEAEARAVLLTGAGRAFSSGAKLESRRDAPGGRRDLGERLEQVFNPIVQQMRICERPIVVAVNGAAAGVGCAIACAGDLILAAESAYFLQAFRNIGLVPDGGSTYLLSRAIGRVRAMEMMLLAERLPAAKALDWGLINRVVPDDALMHQARAAARACAEGPFALGLIKRTAWTALDTNFDGALAAERFAQREAGLSSDFVEGVQAFFEKRPAKFEGR